MLAPPIAAPATAPIAAPIGPPSAAPAIACDPAARALMAPERTLTSVAAVAELWAKAGLVVTAAPARQNSILRLTLLAFSTLDRGDELV